MSSRFWGVAGRLPVDCCRELLALKCSSIPLLLAITRRRRSDCSCSRLPVAVLGLGGIALLALLAIAEAGLVFAGTSVSACGPVAGGGLVANGYFPPSFSPFFRSAFSFASSFVAL